MKHEMLIHTILFYVAALQVTSNAFEKLSQLRQLYCSGYWMFQRTPKKNCWAHKNMPPELYQFQVTLSTFFRFLTVLNHSYKKPTSMHIWNSPCLVLKAKIPMDASMKSEAKACRKLIEKKLKKRKLMTNWRFSGPRCSWLIKLDAWFSWFF